MTGADGRRRRLTAGGASALVLAATTVALGASTPGYDPWAETISALGAPGRPHAVLARLSTVAYGLLVAAAAGPLAALVDGRGRGRVVSGAVLTFGGAGVVAGLAPKDPLAAHAPMSQVHVAATVVGGAVILLAMALVACLSPSPRIRWTSSGGVLSAAALAAAFPTLWGAPVYGLVERALVAIPALWLSGLALHVARREAEPRRVGAAAMMAG